MNKLVVFASGSGSNFQSIIDQAESGHLKVKIAGLLASKPNIGAIARAEKHGISTAVVSRKNFDSRGDYHDEMLAQLERWQPDLIVLAGYLKKIPESVVEAYPGKIINIHPSLLPRHGGRGFYGIRVHESVIRSGDTQSGCTVHYVNEHYDEGNVIDRAVVDVLPGDTPETLQRRVLIEEHKLLPSVIGRLLNSD